MPTHMNMRYEEIEALWPGVEKMQALATQYGIPDIFQDAGGKLLQLLIATGLDVVPGRTGADAKDRMGNEYEIKSVDIANGSKGFTTNHHLTVDTLARYRRRRWVFATYNRIALQEAYLVDSGDLEPVFSKWQETLKTRTHINNPKVPLELVRAVGRVMYMKDVAPPWAVTKNDIQELEAA